MLPLQDQSPPVASAGGQPAGHRLLHTGGRASGCDGRAGAAAPGGSGGGRPSGCGRRAGGRGSRAGRPPPCGLARRPAGRAGAAPGRAGATAGRPSSRGGREDVDPYSTTFLPNFSTNVGWLGGDGVEGGGRGEGVREGWRCHHGPCTLRSATDMAT
uniref:Uncharacterized protein n=1 Tax=Oryza sativa subsp. japonica TaxID=39947 RepID=Q6ZIK3_ORYSJ|nr:hypothetical protein [Oryza sativa Japonica Group]